MLAAEVAPAIVSQLTTSATTLQTLILQHLLHSSVTLNQRAAVLKLLHMSLAPHLDFASLIAKPLDNGMSNSSSVRANAADLAETAATQNEAGVQGSVDSKADEQHDPSVTGQAQLDSNSQQLRIKLFTMVLEAFTLCHQDSSLQVKQQQSTGLRSTCTCSTDRCTASSKR